MEMQRVLIYLAISLTTMIASTGNSQISTMADNCSGDINAWICSLDPRYNPIPDPNAGMNDPRYERPKCQNSDQATGAEKIFVMHAINQAKGKVKQDLCSLTNIFIMKGRAAPGSWGFYESPTYHSTSGNTYIALNENDLNITFSEIQDRNRSRLGIRTGSHSETNLPTSTVMETWGLLYVLAHEMGHIKWHRDQTCKTDVNGKPWSDVSSGQSRWTGFGTDFGIRDTSSIPRPHGNLTAAQLTGIYQGDFATALSSSNPEEDFVETYSLRALKKACGSACKFRYVVGGTTIELMDDNRGTQNLKSKVNCTDTAGG